MVTADVAMLERQVPLAITAGFDLQTRQLALDAMFVYRFG